MRVKQRRLGVGLISRSIKARVMMVCICPRKKRTRSGLRAPGCCKISVSAALSYGRHQMRRQRIAIPLPFRDDMLQVGRLLHDTETLSLVSVPGYY